MPSAERARLRAALLQLLQEVGVALGRAESTDRAVRIVGRLVCLSGPWHVAHAYLAEERDGSTLLVPTSKWLSRDKSRFPPRRLANLSHSVWAGRGLIGHVFRSGRPTFIQDVRLMSEGVRPAVSDLGLRAALIVPSESVHGVQAVVEFYSADPVVFPDEWLSAARSIGVQLGAYIARKELERAVADYNVEERRAMSRELHDSLGQQVAALGLMASRLRQRAEHRMPEELAEIDRLVDVIRGLKAQVRSLIEDLGPLEATPDNLVSSLKQLAEHTATLHDIVCEFDGDGSASGLEPTVAQQLLYVAREAVHNAVKHGAAKCVVLTLREGPERIILGVRDDGSGFVDGVNKPVGRGMTIMRYRAGLIDAHLKIISKPGRGTVVRCVVPKRGGD